MIIKVERYGKVTQDYWMLDGIRKISVSMPLKANMADDLPSHDITILDREPGCTCRAGQDCIECVFYRVIIGRTQDGMEFSLAFDTTAYVMNDQGKTIERIVANPDLD